MVTFCFLDALRAIFGFVSALEEECTLIGPSDWIAFVFIGGTSAKQFNIVTFDLGGLNGLLLSGRLS